RVEGEAADDATEPVLARLEPSAAGAFEGVEDEVDADLGRPRVTFGVEDVVGGAVDLEARATLEVGGGPIRSKLAVAIGAGDAFGAIEAKALVHLFGDDVV